MDKNKKNIDSILYKLIIKIVFFFKKNKMVGPEVTVTLPDKASVIWKR